MYVKRVKAARVKFGMHPYDYRYDTAKQKNELTVELRSLLGEDEE